ncbi:MAG: Hsp20/alpha crystallin family protein, partial [Verrucomicrobiota bacterium]|nr:Hsp20/alpha crystallin family protein [Verrucomicrobiota bacterium]
MNTLTKEPEKNQTVNGGRQQRGFATPAANILETKDHYLVQAEMPGVSKDGLHITVEKNEFSIIGHRSDGQVAGVQVYGESRPLDYRRVFEIDSSIDASKISAKIEQGVLTLTLPKAESLK